MVMDEKVMVLESEKADIQTKLRDAEKAEKEVEKRFEEKWSASQLATMGGLEKERGCTQCIVAKKYGWLRWTRSFPRAFVKVLARGGEMAKIKLRGAFQKVVTIVKSEGGQIVSEEGAWLTALI